MRGYVLVVLALLLTLGCSEALTLSDTGYTGTWSRGNERVKSIIAIARVGDEYRFRWSKASEDGKYAVRCDWDGRCEELLEGRKIAEHTFRTWTDPESRHMMIEAHEKRFQPDPIEIHYVDELVVEPDGRTLKSYTIERDGEKFEPGEGPNRTFTKVADAVASPPPGASS